MIEPVVQRMFGGEAEAFLERKDARGRCSKPIALARAQGPAASCRSSRGTRDHAELQDERAPLDLAPRLPRRAHVGGLSVRGDELVVWTALLHDGHQRESLGSGAEEAYVCSALCVGWCNAFRRHRSA